MVRILATSVAALCLIATGASAQDARDAFTDLCLANSDTDKVREAVIAKGWIRTSDGSDGTMDIWKPTTGSSAAYFVSFGRIPGTAYGSTLPADVCFIVAPGTDAAAAAADIERIVGLAPNGGSGVWMVSRDDQGFELETALINAAPDVVGQAAATRDVRLLSAIPGDGLALYMQMIPVASAGD